MYDPLKDYGGYEGRKPLSGPELLGLLLSLGVVKGGMYVYDKINSIRQKKLWNNGVCAKCGKKWRYHWFFPKGSRGKYKMLAIDCDNCKIHQDMDAYTPEGIKKPM